MHCSTSGARSPRTGSSSRSSTSRSTAATRASRAPCRDSSAAGIGTATGKRSSTRTRAWLHSIEFLLRIEPNAKLIVCLRELGQIYGSIEAQHQRTILMDFPDDLADYDRFGRAEKLFAKDRTVGSPLRSLEAIADLPSAVQERLYILRYEDLVERPVELMSQIYAWAGVSPLKIDPNRLTVIPARESDSHYGMKYLHTQHERLATPQPHPIPPRIQAQIEAEFAWYYRFFYPQHAMQPASRPPSAERG